MYLIRLNSEKRNFTLKKVGRTLQLKQVGRRGLTGPQGPSGPAASNIITSVNGKIGDVVLDKSDVGLGNVPNLNTTTAVAQTHTHANKSILDATTASFTTTDETKLDGIADGATANSTDAQLRDRSTHTGVQPISSVTNLQSTLDSKASITYVDSQIADIEASDVESVNGRTGAVVLTSADVGLSNVDNTSDLNKPISTATQTALDDKVDVAGDTMTGTLNMNNGGFNIPADNYTISTPPLKFVYPDMTDAEDSKGAIIEWGGVMDGVSHPYGIATYAYQQNPSATFTAPTGYKKWAWVTAHYDSPSSTGEDIHQHLNLETVKADWLTAITRFQISFGEDIALTSFPNTHVKIYPDLNFQIGSDAAAAYIKHDTANAKIAISGNTPWNWTGTGGVRIGSSGAPSARLHIERADDGNTALLRNTGASNTSANLLLQTQTSSSRVLQAGVQSDSTNRLSIEASGLIEWGSGSATRDTNLYRFAANELQTDDAFNISSLGSSLGLRLYNTSDQTTNYERFIGAWSSNIFTLYTSQSGTGSARTSRFGSTTNYFESIPSAITGNPKFTISQNGNTSGSIVNITHATGAFIGSSGTQYGLSVSPTYNQTSTAAGVDLLVNRTETAVGTGVQKLIDLRVAGVSRFSVDNGGGVSMQIATVSADTTLSGAHYTVLVDATAANRTITLPAAATNTGRVYNIKKTDSSANTVTVDGNASETIQGAGAAATTQVISTQGSSITIQCNGTGWFVI